MNNEKIIDYIYDEMSAEERVRFETEMKNNPAFRHQVKEMQTMSGILKESISYLPEKESPIRLNNNSKLSTRNIKGWMGLAAALLLGLMAYVGGIRCQLDEGKFSIGFLDHEVSENPTQAEYLSKTEFIAAIGQLKQQIADQENMVPAPGLQKKEAEKMISDALSKMENKYQKWTGETMVAFQENSRNQTEDIVNEFLEYYEITRSEDLKNINQVLTNLSLLVQETSGNIPGYAYQPTQK